MKGINEILHMLDRYFGTNEHIDPTNGNTHLCMNAQLLIIY